MNLEYSADHQAYRKEVRLFLEGWPLSGTDADLPEAEGEALFRQRGIEAGHVYRNIPREYGGGGQSPDGLKDQIVLEEFSRAGAPGGTGIQRRRMGHF